MNINYLLLAIIIYILYNCFNRKQSNKYILGNGEKLNTHICDNKKNNIKTLIRQTSRWAIASTQDKSPLIALLHANYSAGYLWALRDIASDMEIKQVTNVDIVKFIKNITNIQDKATKIVSKNCPNFVGDLDPTLLKIAGDL